MDKRAIRIALAKERLSGFYSRYFLIPKNCERGLKGQLSTECLVRFDQAIDLRQSTYRMRTSAFTYFLIPGNFSGVTYEYLPIPFRLSLARRVFTKCVEAALTPLRNVGIRIFAYIEDYLMCSPSGEQAVRDTTTVVDHLSKLGFRVNPNKSCLNPAQEIV